MADSMKVRATAKDGMAEVKVLITHPMEPGNRKDQKTGKDIESHFIQEISFAVNGKSALTGQLSGGVSKNPYLYFQLPAKAGDTLNVAWLDNKGEKDSIDVPVQ
jgi:sulfur-oxidizing protein SoxZ